MFFTDQLDDVIRSERKAFRSYFSWLVIVLVVSILFVVISALQEWFTSQLGPTLSSAFLLLLSKPPFYEMMKRRERIKSLEKLKNMALVAPAGSPEASEVEKLIIRVFKDMIKK
jgi:hypothetical protein